MTELKPDILKHVLEAFTGDLRAVTYVDNNFFAGRELKNVIEGLKIDFKSCFPEDLFKDWNKQLQTFKK